MVYKCYNVVGYGPEIVLKTFGAIYVLISKYNKVMVVMNHILLAHTRPVPVIATEISWSHSIGYSPDFGLSSVAIFPWFCAESDVKQYTSMQYTSKQYTSMTSREFFSIWNHHKYLSQIFSIHLNTYIMGLRPLEIFLNLTCRVEIDFTRQNMHMASLGRRDGLISAQVTTSSPSL